MLTVEKFKMWHDLRGNVLECQYLVILFFKVKIVLCKIYVIQKKCLAPVGWVNIERLSLTHRKTSAMKKKMIYFKWKCQCHSTMLQQLFQSWIVNKLGNNITVDTDEYFMNNLLINVVFPGKIYKRFHIVPRQSS